MISHQTSLANAQVKSHPMNQAAPTKPPAACPDPFDPLSCVITSSLLVTVVVRRNEPWSFLTRLRPQGRSPYPFGQPGSVHQAAAHRLLALFETDAEAIGNFGRAAGNLLRVFHTLRRRPVATIDYLADASGVSYATAVRAVRTLTETGLLRELTGRRRDRVFAYDRYLAILSEGAQPL